MYPSPLLSSLATAGSAVGWLTLILTISAVCGVSNYTLALVKSDAREVFDFNLGVVAFMASRNVINPRGDRSNIVFVEYPASVLAAGLPPGVLGVVGGSFDDSATWQVNYNSNLLFPASPRQSQLNTTSVWGLAPHLEQIVFTVVKSILLKTFAVKFGIIVNQSSPACSALSDAVVLEFKINGLLQPTIQAASGNFAADVTALVKQGVQSVVSCATSSAEMLAVTTAALSKNATVFFPYATPSSVGTALSSVKVPDNGVWVARWLSELSNKTNPLVQRCRAVVPALTSEYMMAGCLASTLTERIVKYIDAPSDGETFRFTFNRLAIQPAAFNFTSGPFTPSCRASTTAEAYSFKGGVLGPVNDTDAAVRPCAVGVATRMQPIVGVQLVWDNPDSIAAADALVAGAQAYNQNRNLLLQSPMVVQRVLVPTPDGPLPPNAAAALAALNTSYGIGLWGCVDITRQLVDDLSLFSLGRVDATAAAPSQSTNDVSFLSHDGLVFALIEQEVLTAFQFAQAAAGTGAILSLVAAVDTSSAPLWFDTVRDSLDQYQAAFQTTGATTVQATPSTLVAATQAFDIAMFVGPPTAANAKAVCDVVNNGSTSVLLPQMLADSVTFNAAVMACVTQPWNLLFMRCREPSGATQLGLSGFAARGYFLASLSNTLVGLASPTNASLFGQPLDVETALYHSGTLSVDDVSVGGLTAVPCALAKPGQACECSSASRNRIVSDANGLSVQVIQVSPCSLGSGFSPGSSSNKYVAANWSMCGVAAALVVVALLIAHAAQQLKTDESELTKHADPRLLKSVAEEVQAVLPAIHRRSRLFMVPFLVISITVGFGAILPLHFTVSDRLTALTTETDDLKQVQSVVECAASFGNFLLPVASATQIPTLSKSCAGIATQLQLPAIASLVTTMLSAASTKLRAGALLNSTDVPFGQVICPVAAQATMNSLRAGADRASVSLAAASAARVSVALGLASFNGALNGALDFAAGRGAAPPLSSTDVSLYWCFENAFSELAALVETPLASAATDTRSFVSSDQGWAVNHALSCLAADVATDGRMTAATAKCVEAVLTKQRLSEADMVTLMANWSTPLVAEAMTLVRTAVSSPQHDDLYQYLVTVWLAVAVSVVIGGMMRFSAARVMTASAAQYHDAVTRSKVVEANIARYISVSMLELMDVSSVHEIGNDGALRDVIILHVDFERAFYKAVRKLGVSHGELLRRLGQAITAEAGSGRVESVTDRGSVILFEKGGEALSSATRLESALSALLSGLPSGAELTTGDVARQNGGGDSEDDDAAEEPPAAASATGKQDGLPRVESGLDSAEEVSGQVPLVCVALHREVVAVGFMFTGRYQFPGAHGNGIRVARRLSSVARRYGARIVATSNVIDSIPADELAGAGSPSSSATGVLRELGPVRGKWFDVAVLFEVCTPTPRCRLDQYKPKSVDAMKAVSLAQQVCGTPATEEETRRYIEAVSRAAQLAQEADVTDPAIGRKYLWSGAGPFDDVAE